MKKYFLLLLMFIPVLLFAQGVESPIYEYTGFWAAIIGAALLFIEWVLNAVPTNKTWGFVLRGLKVLLEWLLDRVDDKDQNGNKRQK